MLLPKLPPPARKHTEERLKLAASGLQLLALALFGAGLLAPLFNSALTDPLWAKAVISILAGLAESAAFKALRYIPFQQDP